MLELLARWRAGDPCATPVAFAGFGVLAQAVGVEFQSRFEPRGGEWRVQKPVPDAFCANSLEADLWREGIVGLVIVGVATNNSVESTARTAGNLGFAVWVVADACYTFDKPDFSGRARSAEEEHAMSLVNLDGECATVLDLAQLLAQEAGRS